MIPSSRFLAPVVSLIALTFAASAAEIPKPPDINRIKSDVYKMRSGTIRVKDPDDKALAAKNLASIKAVAEWLAYTIATPPYNGEPVPREDTTPKGIIRTMTTLMDEAETLCRLDASAGNQGKLSIEQLEYGEEMGAAIATAAKVVLANSGRPIERINAVRLMSIAAKMPSTRIADPLVEIISNTKISDAEKLYAFHAVKNLMDQTETGDPTRHVIRDVNLLGRIANSLTDYITQKRSPRDDREKAVIEFVRRHAVMALAAFKEGVIRKPNKDLIARPSWTLARVLEFDPSVSPPFTMADAIEAGVGFCQMKVDPDMNLDVAAYTVAKLMFIFAREANLDVERAGKEGTLPSIPWKVAAARLSYALAVWREATKPLAKTRFPDTVVSIANAGIAMLAPIEDKGGIANTARDIATITTWAQNNPPKAWAEGKSAQLYKDDPNSVLPFAAPTPPKKDAKLTTPDATKGPAPKAVDPKKGPTPPK
jgi:hypothetical protein